MAFKNIPEYHIDVSIITPLFNCEDFLHQTWESIKNQTFKNWEWIVVDDCSTDNSYSIACKIAESDLRIKLHKLKANQGAAVARNLGIAKAKGRYIAFLDSDDLWRPEKLEKQVNFMIETDCPFSYSYYEEMDESGKPMNKIIRSPLKLTYNDMLKTNYIGCLTAMYDTQKLGKVFMPLIRKRQDYGLWLALLKKTKYVQCIPESLACYRVRKDSISSNKSALIKYQWELFHRVEGLSVLETIRCIAWNILIKLLNLK